MHRPRQARTYGESDGDEQRYIITLPDIGRHFTWEEQVIDGDMIEARGEFVKKGLFHRAAE